MAIYKRLLSDCYPIVYVSAHIKTEHFQPYVQLVSQFSTAVFYKEL